MASVDVSAVQNMYKIVYGDDASFIKASDEERQIQDTFPFEAGDKPGEEYQEPRRMSGEHGYTFRERGELKNFNPSIPLKIEKAGFLGKILEFTSELEIDAVASAVAAGKQAFKSTIGVVQEAMRDSLIKQTEWTLLRGGTPVGIIEAVNPTSPVVANRRLVTITAGSWTPTFLAEMETAPFDIYDATSVDLDPTAIKQNNSAADAKFTLISFDMETRVLEMEATAASDWTDGPVAAGFALWRFSSYLKEDLGMLAITADQTGSLFLKSPSRDYAVLKGVLSETGGQITFARIQKMVAVMARRSGKKANWMVRCSPLQWYRLELEAAASRNYDASYKSKATNGFAEIEFTSPHGLITIRSHSFMADGDVHVADDTQYARRGVSDLDFTNFSQSVNGTQQNYNYLPIQERNAVQMRAFSQQGMFCRLMGRTGLFRNLDVPDVSGGI